MLDFIRQVREALAAGGRIREYILGKRLQLGAADIKIILGFALMVAAWFGWKLDIRQDELLQIAGGIAAAVGVFHRVLTVATTDKIGGDYGAVESDASMGGPSAAAAAPLHVDEHASDDGHYLPPAIRGDLPVPSELPGTDPRGLSRRRALAPLPRERERDAGARGEFVDDGRNAGG